MHYDGGVWSGDKLPPTIQVISVGGYDDVIFAGGAASDSVMIFRKVCSSWELIDKQSRTGNLHNPRFGYSAFYSPERGILYGVTWGVFVWDGDR